MPTGIPVFSATAQNQHFVEIWVQSTSNANNGSWEVVPRLRCSKLKQTVQPYSGISSAVLTYEYGIIDDSGAGFQTFGPLGSNDSILHDIFGATPGDKLPVIHKFVRIMLYDPDSDSIKPVWAGCVTSVEDRDFKQPRPPATTGNTVDSIGNQALRVSGPEWLLNRTQIVTSRIWNHKKGAEEFVGRAVPFNQRNTNVSQGNSTQSANRNLTGPEQLAFGTDFINIGFVEAWRSNDIVDYLHAQHFPFSLQAEAGPPFNSPHLQWTLSNTEILQHVTPAVKVHGKTCYQVLNEIIDPKRFLNWNLEYVDAGASSFGSWLLRVNSASGEDLTLPNQDVIPANLRPITLVTSGTIDGHISLSDDGQNLYEQVIVLGARQGHVMTVQVHGSAVLAVGWSPEDEAKYLAGAAAEPDYAALERRDQEDRDKNFHSQQLQHVFTRFEAHVDADLNTIGITTDQYIPGLRWERDTPLKMDWDYSIDPPVPKPDSGRAATEYQPLVAIYKMPARPVVGQPPLESYAYANKIDANSAEESLNAGKLASVKVRPTADAWGVRLEPSSRPPHYQAKGETVITQDDSVTQVFDYKTDIHVTGYWLADEFASAFYPDNINNAGRNAATLFIRVGDVAFYDILHRNTIIDIGPDGKPITSPVGTDILLRDDTDELASIARLAFEWYAKTRYAYQISYAQLVQDVVPGMQAVNIDGATTDVVVTQVDWDFDQGGTSITTAFAEPDLAAIGNQVLRNKRVGELREENQLKTVANLNASRRLNKLQ